MMWARTNRPVWLRCTVGILVAVIAAAIRLQFLEILELRAAFLTFYPAVAVATLYGGFSAGLAATAVSAVLAGYFWMEPLGRLAITNFADLMSMAVFLASGALISSLAEATYRAQARAHKAEEQSRLAGEREKAAVDLQQSESKYRELVQNANSVIIRWKRDGAIAFFNEYAQKFFGYSAQEVIGKSVNILVPEQESTGGDLTELVQDIVNHPERYANNINENILRDGSRVWMAWSNRPVFDQDGQVLEILAVASDITECKRAEMERESTVEFLHFVNRTSATTDLVRAAAMFFQRQSGCEAVGIRLKEWDDYPYREARGFPQEFVEMENSLCARDAAGNIIRDSSGDPYIECLCGNVISGRVDPSKPFFSPGGSFWANSTTRLLAATSDTGRQAHTRKRCNGEGYESVALIPLNFGAERLGLVQLNDRREGMFSPEVIAQWEKLAGYLAVGLAKSRADEKIQHQNAILETINQVFYRALTCETEEQLGIACLAALENLTQSKFSFIGEIGPDGLLHDLAISNPGWELCAMYDKRGHRRSPGDFKIHGLYGRVLLDGKSLLTNGPSSHPDSIGIPPGHPALTGFLGVPLFQDGRIIGMVGLGNREGGYTQEQLLAVEAIAPALAEALMRRRTEAALSQSQSRFKLLSETSSMDKLSLIEELRNSRDELELRVRERTAELNRYMAKLEQSNQALQDFAYIAAHDMKEPLRKVMSFGNLLSQKYKDSLGQTGNDYLDRMLHATERMQSLLTGLLDYSRVATAAEPFEEVDLSGLIGEVISDLEARTAQTGGEVHVGDLPVISADPTQMRQLFQNLIGNALKFHKPGEKPMVQVRFVSHTDSGCQIIVEDNGIGFDEQYLDKIFAPFQRLHARSEYEGTGMGLAICKKIVERHGGSIIARSTPGAGSKFIVTLPVRSRKD